jgi:hypothetical protein
MNNFSSLRSKLHAVTEAFGLRMPTMIEALTLICICLILFGPR